MTAVTLNRPAVATSEASRTKVTWFALTYVVARAEPLTWMPVPGTMPVPDTVMIVLVVLPAGTVDGDRAMPPSAELLIAMDAPLDVPPPGAGVNALTARLPAIAWSATVNDDSNCVELMKVVGRASPLTCTTVEGTKFAPVTVIGVAVVVPVETRFGVTLIDPGAGFFTANETAGVLPPPGPGFVATIEREPAVARSAEVSDATSCVPLT